MSEQQWRHVPAQDGKPESWYVASGGDPICAFYRSPEYDNAWVIMGRGRNGSTFLIVSVNNLVDEVKREAELTLYDFGWVPK